MRDIILDEYILNFHENKTNQNKTEENKNRFILQVGSLLTMKASNIEYQAGDEILCR